MDDLAARLLERLVGVVPGGTAGYANTPASLGNGFDTRVFAFRLRGVPPEWSGPLVLRLFRPETPTERVRFEAAVHEAVRRQDYPAPRILHAECERDALDGAFVVMERVPGEPLLDGEAFRARTLRFPALLAEAHLRLHDLSPAPFEAALAAAGVPLAQLRVATELDWYADHVAALELDGLAPAIDWLRAHRPPPAPPAVCHGDFHPFNVIADRGRVTGVIDWTTPHVKVDDPASDVGATVALLSHGPIDVPPWLRRSAAWVRGRLVDAYRAAYLRARPLPGASLDYFVALRLVGFLTEAGEHRLADLGRRPRTSKRSAFTAPAVLAGILRDLELRTGVRVVLPG